MKRKHILCTLLLALCICGSLFAKAPKYVFYFIGDGMGVNQVMGTQYFMRQSHNELGITPLCFAQFPYTGLAITHSANSDVTDSAAAGTALAAGKKTNNGTLGITPDGTSCTNIAEMAHAKGIPVGIATSVTINHATPAAFYAHVQSRNSYYEIGKALPLSGYEFFAGGNFRDNQMPGNSSAPTLYDLARKEGYEIFRGYETFTNRSGKEEKIILVQEEHALEETIPFAIDAKKGDLTLTQITKAAIEVLYKKESKKGFFTMIEGGKIDWACHSNDAATVFREVIDFDNAIRVAYDFYKQHPHETLIVITADHETGGMGLGGYDYTLNLNLLAQQKVSKGQFSRIINQLRHDTKDNVTWEQIKKALRDNFGFWDCVDMREYDEKALHECYQKSFNGDGNIKMAESLYFKDEPIAELAVQILNRRSRITWCTGAHTGGYVPVFAIGAGAETFVGQYDNTEIPKKIAKQAHYE